jgi:hypothetical protein
MKEKQAILIRLPGTLNIKHIVFFLFSKTKVVADVCTRPIPCNHWHLQFPGVS